LNQSCRNALKDLKEGSNASLLLAKYLTCNKGGDGDKNEALGEIQALRDRVKFAVTLDSTKALYEAAFKRWQRNLDENGAVGYRYSTDGPMVIGMSGATPLDTGLTLNPLFGVPMIPGSAIKGMVAHYCSEVLGAAEGGEAFKGPALDEKNRPTQSAGAVYEALFGKIASHKDAETGHIDNNAEEFGGFITFYDAWLVPESLCGSIRDDVMTPHHMEYYGGSQDLPTDFDSPNPVSLLTVCGNFEFRIGCCETDKEKRNQWIKLVADMLTKALKAYGIGGKTRTGYGRMKPAGGGEGPSKVKVEKKKLSPEEILKENNISVGSKITVQGKAKVTAQRLYRGIKVQFDPPLEKKDFVYAEDRKNLKVPSIVLKIERDEKNIPYIVARKE
jgi:CRISPR-associated protein Cmr6